MYFFHRKRLKLKATKTLSGRFTSNTYLDVKVKSNRYFFKTDLFIFFQCKKNQKIRLKIKLERVRNKRKKSFATKTNKSL